MIKGVAVKSPEEVPKFMVDGMLGKLCRWLRFFGFDAEYAGCEISDSEVIFISQSQNRILVTSDRELASRFRNSILLSEKAIKRQIRRIVSEFPPDPEAFLSRCSLCNGELEQINLKGLRESLPESVYGRQLSVRQCKKCRKFYWDGTHQSSIMKTLRELTGELT
jgi:uncharacterized protein with PIN domain